MPKKRKREWSSKELYLWYFALSFMLLSLISSYPLSTHTTCLTSFIIIFISSLILPLGYISLKNYIKYRYFSPLRKIKDVRYYLQGLNPFEFENAVAEMFKNQGYKKVEKTSKSHDYGADIIMKDKKTRYVVEVKKYAEDNLVGRPLLQKLQGAADYYYAIGMKFVTLGYFSSTAKEYAKRSNIHLIDGDELIKLMCKNHRRGTGNVKKGIEDK